MWLHSTFLNFVILSGVLNFVKFLVNKKTLFCYNFYMVDQNFVFSSTYFIIVLAGGFVIKLKYLF